MGVAVMTRRWVALPFSRNMARWTTPKRLLFIDDDECEVGKCDVVLQQGMCADS